MKLRTLFLIQLYFFVSIQFFFPLEEVGKIISITGNVLFDIQGKNLFIKPQAGDTLYDQSVIKTGANGLAVITIYTKELKVPPESLFHVSDMLNPELRTHHINETVFKQLLQSINTILKNSFEKVEKRGKGRMETEAFASLPPRQFISEKDFDTDIPEQVKEAFIKKDYGQAQHIIMELEKSANSDEPPRGYYALQALCSFFSNDYHQAIALFGEASERLDNEIVYAQNDIQNEISILNYLSGVHFRTPGIYVLLSGISSLLENDDGKALPYLKSLLQQETANDLKPYTYYFLSLALIRTGANNEARQLLQAALIKYKESLLALEWRLLLRDLNH